MSSYDRFPRIRVKTDEKVIRGYGDILSVLSEEIRSGKRRIAVETYPGVRDSELRKQFEKLDTELFLDMKDIFLTENEMTAKMEPWLTDDRVFGKMFFGNVEDFFDPAQFDYAVHLIENTQGAVLVYGFGASLLFEPDLLVYCDMARWEIQLRYRAGMGNYNCSNFDEDILRKYKRGFFVEWRMADRHKVRVYDAIDYLIDTNRANDPKMITGAMFKAGLETAAHVPFRLVPYFDPGVWGGQWMKEHCNLDPEAVNYAWSFDGVPEENSLLLGFENAEVEIPAMDLTLFQPRALLGEKNYARFGAEFPIRFDFLDTMEGQNLSLQVHPLTEYIRSNFGMAYTQDESYYMLDAKEDACVYLGVKNGTRKEDMLDALRTAQESGVFDAEAYVNRFPAKKHDHFLIPAGTIHCSGKNSMVLEISATPYIFTFKLWDWGRLGLDGKPRPINIEHGSKVIQWNRNTDWAKENIVNRFEVLADKEDYKEEKTGLHALEFIETRRYTIKKELNLELYDSFSMCNLVEGERIRIESPDESFEPYEVHYAETFILPAALERVRIVPMDENVMVLRAYVRGSFAEG